MEKKSSYPCKYKAIKETLTDINRYRIHLAAVIVKTHVCITFFYSSDMCLSLY